MKKSEVENLVLLSIFKGEVQSRPIQYEFFLTVTEKNKDLETKIKQNIQLTNLTPHKL
jgi:hypothetical protein